MRKANISFSSDGGLSRQRAGEGLPYLLRLLFSFPPKLRISELTACLLSKHPAGKRFERDGQVLPQRMVCSLSLVPRPLSHHPASFVCLHCSSCSVLSFLLRRQFSKHFLSIFCLHRSVLGPGGTGMVKILTQLLRGRKEGC